MPKSFQDFCLEKTVSSVVEGLTTGSISFETFSEWVEKCKNASNDEELNEAFFSNHGGGLTNLARTGAGMVGNGLNSLWQGAKNVAGRVGGAIGRAGQGVANVYMQGENINKLKTAMDQVEGLRQFFQETGYSSPTMQSNIDKALNYLTTTIQRALMNVQQNNASRMGQPSLWGKQGNQQPMPNQQPQQATP